MVGPILLAPAHQRLAGKAAVGAQENPNMGPTCPDLHDDLRDLFKRAGGRVDVRAPQPGRQQMPAAEDIQRQVQ